MIKQWLKAHNKTQAWLANELGVTPAAVSLWTTDGVPARRALELHRLTGISVHELLRDRK